MTFVHVSVRTNDMDSSIEFYEGYFGLRVDRRREIPSNNAEIAFLKDPEGEFALELTWYKGQDEFKQVDYEKRVWDHLAFTVQDLRAMIERMRKDGVTITDEPFQLGKDGPHIAFIEDPVGVLIELIERR